eukprot:5028563-Ditylum_brightwellii.AAC.1
MAKVDLSNAYMQVWIWLEEILVLAFIIPPHSADAEPLIGFHLSAPMGYIESMPLFCSTTKTVSGIANASWHENLASLLHPHHPTPPLPLLPTHLHILHPLKTVANFPPSPNDEAALDIAANCHKQQLHAL